MAHTFHIASFGCRASQSEGAAIEEELGLAGARPADSPFDADVVVVKYRAVREAHFRRSARQRPLP
jgi:tRNA A37 methylthiotransferase MiaB